jgi:hypothetical protein
VSRTTIHRFSRVEPARRPLLLVAIDCSLGGEFVSPAQ